jgi:[methyl-Co(III) methanol-specific corrinoid protein]:coenzyme M methyltransferase
VSATTELSHKERALRLIRGEPVDRIPCFSGMGNVLVEGLERHGLRFAAIHRDARQMALSAAETPKMCGLDSAVVPFDMCVEAAALGCQISFYEQSEDILYPTIPERFVKTADDINVPADVANAAPIPVVAEAIRLLKEDIGEEYAVGSWVLGPFTLAGQIMDLNDLLKMSFKQPAEVGRILGKLAAFLVDVANVYLRAGADYITVREMGAPTDILSPRIFKSLIQPYVMQVIAGIPRPRVLHICGDTNAIVEYMNQCGADAISVEMKNNLVETRKKIGPEPLLLGNVDGYRDLVAGTPESVRQATLAAIEAGVDGVWPGCDVWPTAPVANLQAMVEAAASCPPRRR